MGKRIRHKILTSSILIFYILISLTKLSAQAGPFENRLSIIGNTNLSSFSFNQSFPIFNKQSNRKYIWKLVDSTEEFRIHIPVEGFIADNRLMYSDFMKLIKSDVYPDIIISIKKTDLYDIRDNDSNRNPKVLINLAGVRKEYIITCESIICMESGIFIRGSREVKLTDFKLTPPVKSLGLIKVKNNVFINFEFGLPFEVLSINNSES